MKNKEQYMQEMEVYKQRKEEEAANLKKDGEEFMKLQKQEAMQLLKKKEKAETLIKVFYISEAFSPIIKLLILLWAYNLLHYCKCRKTKRSV